MSPLDKVSQIDRWTACLQGTSEWAESVYLPLKNPFVPTDFNIRTSTAEKSVAGLDAAVASMTVNVSEAKAVPDLIECVTTLSVETEEEAAKAAADIVVSAEVTEDKTADESAAKEAEDDEDEEGEEEPAGQLPPLEGKVTQSYHFIVIRVPPGLNVCQIYCNL